MLALTAPEGVTVFVPAQAHSNTKPKALATTLSTGFFKQPTHEHFSFLEEYLPGDASGVKQSANLLPVLQ